MAAMKRLILTVLMRAALVAAVIAVGKPSAAEAQTAGGEKEEKAEKEAARVIFSAELPECWERNNSQKSYGDL